MTTSKKADACPSRDEIGTTTDKWDNSRIKAGQIGTNGTSQEQGWDKQDKPQLTKQIIVDWIKDDENVHGRFTAEAIRKGLRVESDKGRETLRRTLNRLCVGRDAILRHWRDQDGVYEKLETTIEEMDWENADVGEKMLAWPFGLEEYVKVYPRTLVVLAGDTNAGKSAFAYNFLAQNAPYWSKQMTLYSNETAVQLLKLRFVPLGITLNPKPPFRTIERDDKFEDIMDPDGISVIDYIQIPEDVSTMQYNVTKIWNRLKTGVVLACMQKKPGSDLPYGGWMTIHHAQISLALEKDKLKIVKSKVPRDPMKHPVGLTWNFWLEQGVIFHPDKEPHRPL